MPAASVALAPPEIVRFEERLVTRSDATLDVDIKFVVELNIIVDSLSQGADQDKFLALLPKEKKGAVTRITFPTWTKFAAKSKFEWRGAIVIQTIFKSAADAKGYSCYGRGTTRDDIVNGRITLGYHESCHRRFFVDYLKSHPLPLPALKTGMTKDQFEQETARFEKAMNEYDATVRRLNEEAIDEIGYLRSKYLQTDRCYAHTLPLPKPT